MLQPLQSAGARLGSAGAGMVFLVCIASLFAAGAAGAAARPAHVQVHNPENLPAEQLRQIDDLCRYVVGVEPAFSAFSECADSLARSTVVLNSAAAMGRARAACLSRGLGPGGPALANCELAAPGERASAVSPVAAAARPALGPRIAWYYGVSWREALQRRRRACAELGFDPMERGFSDCVMDLQSALFAASQPSS